MVKKTQKQTEEGGGCRDGGEGRRKRKKGEKNTENEEKMG